MENEVLSVIHKRRSTRKYKPEQVAEAELSQVLEAGRFAPSGSNSQTTHFLVFQSPERLAELRELAVSEFAAMEVREGAYQALNAAVQRAKKGGFDFLYNAPTLVVLANRKGYGNAMADCSVALENMMLAATSLGLGCCYINQLRWLCDNEALNRWLQGLGLGEDEIVCSSMALGYSDQKEFPPLERKGNPVTFIK